MSPAFHSSTRRAGRARPGCRGGIGAEHHVRLDPRTSGAISGELPRDGLVDLPVALALHTGSTAAVSGWMKGCMSVVLRSFFSYQVAVGRDHVGVKARGGHAEVEGDEEIELAFRGRIAPDDLTRLLPARLAEIPGHDAVRGAEEVLQKVLVALSGRAEEIRAPHEEVARPVGRVVGVFAGHAKPPGAELLRHVFARLAPRVSGRPGDFEGIRPELRGGRQPAHPLRPHVVVDERTAPVARGCGRGQDPPRRRGLVAPLVRVRVPHGGGVHLPGRTAPVEGERERKPTGLGPKLLLAHVVRPAPSRLAHAAAHHQQVDDPSGSSCPCGTSGSSPPR